VIDDDGRLQEVQPTWEIASELSAHFQNNIEFSSLGPKNRRFELLDVLRLRFQHPRPWAHQGSNLGPAD
jgi:hypothetical protein